jgi:hypothetical protein
MKVSIVVLFTACLVVACGRSADQTGTPAGNPDQAEYSADMQAAAPETPERPEAAAGAGNAETDRLHRADPAGSYGEALVLTEPVSIAAIHEDPESFEGKVVCVEGTVTEVCPMRGCWVELADTEGGSTIRVKVDDGVIVFPLSAKGHGARVEGTVEKLEMTEAEARSWRQHEAAELGEDFDPESVTGPQTIWRIKGRGAEIRS